MKIRWYHLQKRVLSTFFKHYVKNIIQDIKGLKQIHKKERTNCYLFLAVKMNLSPENNFPQNVDNYFSKLIKMIFHLSNHFASGLAMAKGCNSLRGIKKFMKFFQKN